MSDVAAGRPAPAAAAVPFGWTVFRLLLVGLAIRLQFVPSFTEYVSVGEATNIAESLALHGRFADGFFAGQGPTAHMLPTGPVIAAGLLWLFGPLSPASNAALLAWSLIQSLSASLLFLWLFRRQGLPRTAALAGFAFLMLVPIFEQQDVADYRVWEGGLALCGSAASLMLLLDAEAGRHGPRRLGAASLLAAALAFVSPPCGLAIVLCWAVVAVRRLSLAQTVRLGGVAALALACLVGPWALRNERAMGTPILLRDNFGLEIALANSDATLAGPPRKAYLARLRALHPYTSAEGRAALIAAGGEVAYSQTLGRETGRWIAAHPTGFARLCLRHLAGFFFPEPWQMRLSWPHLAVFRAAVTSLVNLFGLIGLAEGLMRRRRGYALFAIYVGVTALPYALVQPVPRYMHLTYPLLCFVASRLLVSAFEAVRRSRRPQRLAAVAA